MVPGACKRPIRLHGPAAAVGRIGGPEAATNHPNTTSERGPPMTEPNSGPVTLSQEQREEIAERMATCPFVGAAVATGQLSVFNSAEDPLAAIDEIARLGDLGGGDFGSRVLKLFARGNHSRWVVPAGRVDPFVPSGMLSLQFGGSQGAHAGHSGILLVPLRQNDINNVRYWL